MVELKFKCTLKTDVILNAKSASEGNNNTLDFIPGSVFLGIVAKNYNSFSDEKASVLFHSGKVRFGDAHPANGNVRSLRIPSQFFVDKIKKTDGDVYVHYRLNQERHKALREDNIQLKQCRTGFYTFESNIIKEVNMQKSFAIKSAHDKQLMTSLKKAMYGYESLQKGATLYFTVEIDDKEFDVEFYETQIIKALSGEAYIGRSRTAQYGLVYLEKVPSFTEYISNKSESNLTTVYADGRLIFLNEENGLPTYQPTVSQLGLVGGKIRWDLSQVRTFAYSPWNAKRQAFDTDRCGLEKGSVIVVENAECLASSSYIGAYNNEGFGKVIYNPSFLDANNDGVSPLSFEKKDASVAKTYPVLLKEEAETDLLYFLASKEETYKASAAVYKEVHDFVKRYQNTFKDATFASQWGHIRMLCMQHHDSNDLYDALFADKTGYLLHGVAEIKWSDRGRRYVLKKKCDEIREMQIIPLGSFLTNLASQMQKIYRNRK